MKEVLVEIITIGDEILIGQIVDTNSAWMAVQLNLSGFKVKQITTVSDNESHIINALTLALSRADIVLMTGGLGPTKDDITKQTLCKFFNTQLVLNQDVIDNINEVLSHRPGALNQLTYSQAYVPQSAEIIQNKRGTAPVTWFNTENKVVVSMPGVPFEMEWVMENEIIPRLEKKFSTPSLYHKTIIVYGIAESSLAINLTEWENNLPDFIKLAYLPSPGLVKLRLTGIHDDIEFLKNIIENETAKLREILCESILAEKDIPAEKIIGELLTDKKMQLVCAESCTGGNISHLLTTIPGSSAFFKGGVVAYSNEVKKQILGVKQETLLEKGAVSREVVEQMAIGALEKFDADVAVAVSGVAGPDGGSEEKPVGTVWISVCTKSDLISRQFSFGKLRIRNINMASLSAFAMIKEILDKKI